MGCIIGGTGFNIAVDHFIYGPLKAQFPRYGLQALTDDLPALIPCPAWDAPEGEWEECYDACAEFYEAYDKRANAIGIFRHNGKCKILIPPGAPLPTRVERGNGITLNVVQDGFVIGGGLVGEEDYYRTDGAKRVAKLQDKVDAMTAVSQEEPQIAYQMIGRCANVAHGFYVRANPPSKVPQVVKEHDGIIERGLNKAMEQDGTRVQRPSLGRAERARALRRLPLRMGGGGILPLAETANPAYLGAVVAVANGPGRLNKEERRCLEPYATAAYHEVCASLGQPEGLSADSPARRCLPANPGLLSRGPFARSTKETNSRCKVSAVVGAMLAVKRKTWLEDECANPANITRAFTKSDATWIMASLRGGSLSQIALTPLSVPTNRLTPTDFTNAMTAALNLPAGTIYDDAFVAEGTDYMVDWCRIEHGKKGGGEGGGCRCVCDINGNHAVGCKATCGERVRAHNKLVRVLVRLAREAGLTAIAEPPMDALLMGQFPAHVLTALLPKVSTEASNNMLVAALERFEEQGGKGGSLLSALENVHARCKEKARKVRSKFNTGGRRLDISIFGPDWEHILVDATRIHPTTVSRVDTAYKFHCALIE